MVRIKDNIDIARYEQIAHDMAVRISKGDFAEGEKIYGRSTLAGQYNVSPETIRRSVALLQGMGIVSVAPGKGIKVLSVRAAKEYISNFNEKRKIAEAQQRYRELLEQRNELDREIETQMYRILSFSSKLADIWPRIEEVRIEKGSVLEGSTLVEAALRNNTGATVVAMESEGESELFTPGENTVLNEGDVLLFIGPPGCREKVFALAGAE